MFLSLDSTHASLLTGGELDVSDSLLLASSLVLLPDVENVAVEVDAESPFDESDVATSEVDPGGIVDEIVDEVVDVAVEVALALDTVDVASPWLLAPVGELAPVAPTEDFAPLLSVPPTVD